MILSLERKRVGVTESDNDDDETDELVFVQRIVPATQTNFNIYPYYNVLDQNTDSGRS